MKLKQLSLCIISLLFISLLPAKIYAEQSSQTMGNDNKNSPQISGDGNTVCQEGSTCNFHTPETPSNNTHTNPSPVFDSPITTQPRNPASLNWCEDPEISNKDKYILQCPGY